MCHRQFTSRIRHLYAGRVVILPQFASVANVTYPMAYENFLETFSVVSFGLRWVSSFGCVVDLDFHGRLLISTIGPLIALVFLGGTYCIAYCVHEDPNTLREIRDKHVSMVLLLTFLVYSSVSSVVFETFATDKDLDENKEYLRADYSIQYDSAEHKRYRAYAWFMIVLYPVGIPLFYAILLWRDRNVLRKRKNPAGRQDSTNASAAGKGPSNEEDSKETSTWEKGSTYREDSKETSASEKGPMDREKTKEASALTEAPTERSLSSRAKAISAALWELLKDHFVLRDRQDSTEASVSGSASELSIPPRAKAISALWEPYKPSMYLFEVFECGRRILLTAVVVFIFPDTATQVAVTLMMAFTFLVLSEWLSPYSSRKDAWMNSLGHIVVFVSMFTALLMKVGVSDERADSQKTFAAILVAANAVMMVMVVMEPIVSLLMRCESALTENDASVEEEQGATGV